MRYGWRRDLPDPRDHVWGMPGLGRLPEVVSLRGEMPAVYDQLKLGACTANAIGACVQHRQMKEHEPEGAETPSRLFIYWNERNLEGHTATDSGAQIRDGMKVVAQLGAPPETDWPYTPDRFADKPPAQAYTDARKYRAVYGRVVQSPRSLQASVAHGRPVVFGFAVFESFELIGTDGIMPIPDFHSEKLLGGHAVVIVGYRQINGQLFFEVRNSWGDGWGDEGYFWMPAQYAAAPELCADFWHIDLET